MTTPKEVSVFAEEYANLYLEVVQLRAVYEILKNKYKMDLQQTLESLINEHGLEAVQVALAATVTNTSGTDPLPPDPTHP